MSGHTINQCTYSTSFWQLFVVYHLKQSFRIISETPKAIISIWRTSFKTYSCRCLLWCHHHLVLGQDDLKYDCTQCSSVLNFTICERVSDNLCSNWVTSCPKVGRWICERASLDEVHQCRVWVEQIHPLYEGVCVPVYPHLMDQSVIGEAFFSMFNSVCKWPIVNNGAKQIPQYRDIGEWK